MGRIGKNKTLVSISIPMEWRAEIDRRADALSLTRAAYVTMIIEQWWTSKCPAISEPDRLMQLNAKFIPVTGNPGENHPSASRHTRERFLALANKNKSH